MSSLRKLVLCLVLSIGVAGCGGGGGGDAPVRTESSAIYPITGQAPALLTADHVGDIQETDESGAVVTDASGNVLYSMPSATFEKLGYGVLLTPVDITSKVARIQPARGPAPVGLEGFELVHALDMLFGLGVDISDWGTGAQDKTESEAEFNELTAHLDEISNQITDLGNTIGLEIDALWSQLNLNNAEQALFDPTSNIAYRFTGTTPDNFSYLSSQASLIQACINTTGYPATCTAEQQAAYYNNELQGESATFATNILGPGYDMGLQVFSVYNAIVPSGGMQILKALARYLVTNEPSTGPQSPKQNAMTAYLILEGMFTQLLTYQYQGAVMVGSSYNQQDLGKPPLDNGQSALGYNANNFITGDFEHYLRDECTEFLNQVDWLAVNYHDYRDKTQYAADMTYVPQGLAPDPIFADVLARSRFYCVQVLEPFNQNRANGDNGTGPVNRQYFPSGVDYSSALEALAILVSEAPFRRGMT